MIKNLFSILVGALFATVVLLLVTLYWLFSLLARVVSLILLPFRKLLSRA